jgi:maltose alpha-D-glucosyltransferase/alpha-amylase
MTDAIDQKYWWKNVIIYEVYVDKFAGTFLNLTQKLPYLKSLGITCIHLLPHYPSPMIDDGYDVTDYMNVRENLGTLQDFQDFMQHARAMGIKVIVDMVLNHTSTQHPWFLEAQLSLHNSKRNFYLWSNTGKEYAGAPNLFPDLKDNNWVRNAPTNDYYFSTFHQGQADLNWNNPDVFSEMMRVLDFWVAIGVDGFRLDAVSHLIKEEGTVCDGLPKTHATIKKIRAYLDERYRDIVLLAEVGDSIPETKKYFGGGDECHLAYNFPLVAQLLIALKNNQEKLPQEFIASMLEIPENCAFVNFLGHHDEMALGMLDLAEKEMLLAYFDPEKKYRFANGVSLRIATMLHNDTEKIIKAFNMLFEIPGVPVIYCGDEIDMENDTLPKEEKDTRKSVRGSFNTAVADKQGLDNASLLNIISHIK